MVLIFVFLIISDGEPVSVTLLVICMYVFFGKMSFAHLKFFFHCYLDVSFAHLKIGLFVLLLLSCMSALNVLDINPLLDIVVFRYENKLSSSPRLHTIH